MEHNVPSLVFLNSFLEDLRVLHDKSLMENRNLDSMLP